MTGIDQKPGDGGPTGAAMAGAGGGNGRKLAGGVLKPLAVLAIAVAAISPTTSVFLTYGSGFSLAGTGIVWAFILGGLIALAMGLCYAEVGSVFPSAGGTYTIIRRALGPVWGGVVLVLFVVLGFSATSSILIAGATYLSSLIPGGLPVEWVALGMMAVITLLSIERISPTGWVTTAMLVLELAVILVFTVICLFHIDITKNPFTDPVVPASHGGFNGVGLSAMLAAIVPALFAFNGYDWPLYFAEETRSARRVIPRAVLLAAGISVVVEVLAVLAATLSIHSISATADSSAPLTQIAIDAMGHTGSKILIAGVVIAMFDTALAGNLGYARVFYAAGRDRMWPGRLNGFFSHISGNQVPIFGFAVLFVGNAVLCLWSSLSELITFTGGVLAIIYLMVAVSAILTRVRDKRMSRSFKMPLWPLAPIIAIIGVGLALSQQTRKDNAIAFGIAAAVLVIYLACRKYLPGRLDGLDAEGGPSRK